MEHQVAAPRVAHQVRGVPSESVQNGGDVGHRLGDRELALLGGRGDTALLVRRDLVAGGELGHRVVEVGAVHARATVHGEHPRALAGDPAREATRLGGSSEGGSIHRRSVRQLLACAEKLDEGGAATVLSDIEIANAATLRPISEVASETLGIDERHLVPYGHYKAKVDLDLPGLARRPAARPAGPGDRAVADSARARARPRPRSASPTRCTGWATGRSPACASRRWARCSG